MVSISREIAFKALSRWAKLPTDPHAIIDKLLTEKIRAEDAGFARELFFGTVKFKRKIDFYASRYHASKNLEPRLKQIIRLGFYQLLQAPNIPDYAVVSESVELAKKVTGPQQVRFVNAMLRNFLRQPDKVSIPDIDSDPVKHLGLTYSFPDWLVIRFIERYGEAQTENLLDWFNRPPQLCFFINQAVPDFQAVETGLESLGLACDNPEYFTDYFECKDPHKLIKSEIFRDGRIIIGDPAQGLAVRALEVKSGETVLDLFAAPGGKSAALAGRLGNDGLVIAVENNAGRLSLMKGNLRRWNVRNVMLVRADALKFATGRKLRAILADVPCSGTGTLRRNPDLRWRLKPDDIGRHAGHQKKLIREAAGLLEQGGRLVYSTCSIEPEENELVVREFLKHNHEYRLKDVNGLEKFKVESGMYRIMPDAFKTDGAFAAVIEKKRRD